MLVFLPGEGEIRRVEALLSGRLPADCDDPPALRRDAISRRSARRSRPAGSGRKVVLATSIAETSLTIEDIRVVVDGGPGAAGAVRSRPRACRGW